MIARAMAILGHCRPGYTREENAPDILQGE